MRLRGMLFSAGILAALSVQGVSAQCNKIDAITTASFDITGGEACSTSAKFNWSFSRSNGEMYVEYGTTTSYGTKKTFVPNAGNNPLSVSPLTPNTTYYFHFWGFYASKNVTKEYYKASFKTSGGTTSVGNLPENTRSAAPGFKLHIGKARIALPAVGGNLKIALYSLNGAAVLNRKMTAEAGRDIHIAPKGIIPGIYLLRIAAPNASSMHTVSVTE